MRLTRLQISYFLQMKKACTCKRGRGIDDATGMHKLTIEQRRIQSAHLQKHFKYSKKVNIMLAFCKISPVPEEKIPLEYQTVRNSHPDFSVQHNTKGKVKHSMKKALITGVTGQDGSYLAEFLIEKGYDVHGMIRRSSVDYRERIAHLEGHPQFHLHYGDLGDSISLVKIISEVRPDEIYNLAAQSHVQVSFDVPEYTADVVATGVLRVLEAVRVCGLEKTCRIYQASTSELYGKVEEVPQSEKTPFHPYSPYAVAKQYGFWIVKEYREAYNMFCCSGILFNHESERRGETFVTRKITLAAARIAQGKQDKLYLGNLSSLRDWGYAKDYVECMWLILQNDKPEDFVIATGVQHSVREFCQLAFHHAGIELEFVGEGMDEKGIDKATGKVLVEVSPDFYRPTDVVNLWGDPTKAKTELGWNPTKTSFEELVKIMVEHDMKKVAVERAEEHIQTNLEEYLEKGIIK